MIINGQNKEDKRMNYEEMSDKEINIAMTMVVNQLESCRFDEVNQAFVMDSTAVGEGIEIVNVVDYCNSWADVGPLINEAYMTISRDSCQAHVSSYFNTSFVISCGNTDEDVLRAAAIVYLMLNYQ